MGRFQYATNMGSCMINGTTGCAFLFFWRPFYLGMLRREAVNMCAKMMLLSLPHSLHIVKFRCLDWGKMVSSVEEKNASQ